MRRWHSIDDIIAQRAGVELTEADRDYMTRSTLYESSEYFHRKFGYLSSPEEVVKVIYDDMLDYYKHEAKPKPGALEFVKGLHELGIPMGVASSTSPLLLKTGIENAGFAPYMKCVMSVEDVGSSKREPKIFNAVREALGTPRCDTWGVEDAVYAIDTLCGAGYHTLAVYDSEIAGSLPALDAAADWSIMSFEDVTVQQFVDKATGFSGRL